MNHTMKLSALFGLLWILLLAGIVLLAVSQRNASPRLPDSMKQAEAQTRALMEAVVSCDYTAVEHLLSGSPDLDTDRTPSDPLSQNLWTIYGSSLSYKFDGPCYADDYGVYRDVTVTMADLTAMMTDIQAHSAILLASKAAADPNAYNADGSYKQDFILSALASQAAKLDANDYLTTRSLTLRLENDGGQWAIRLDRALLDVLAGGIGGA